MTDETPWHLLKVEEVAERLQLSVPQIYRLVGAGDIASCKIGRSRRVPAVAIEQYVRRSCSGLEEDKWPQDEREGTKVRSINGKTRVWAAVVTLPGGKKRYYFSKTRGQVEANLVEALFACGCMED